MDQNPPKESRPPINLRIKFRSENVEQFIERYAVDVSRGGIFIRTREPLAVGTQLKLDFQFQNGTALMAGDGTVVWIREFDQNRTSVPPGMGVRFDKLTAESQAVLEQLLLEKAKRERAGAVTGSASSPSAGAGGGIAVRRPSSTFSALEGSAGGAQPPPAGPTPALDANQPGPLSPLASVTAQLQAPAAKAATATSTGAPGGKTDAAPYRPLGTARNPFSGLGAGGTPSTGNPIASTGAPPEDARKADDAAPFDDIGDEPTQIAGRLPSFLASDEEATVVAGPPLGIIKTELDKAPGLDAKKSAAASGSVRNPLPGMSKVDAPASGKKAESDAASKSAAEATASVSDSDNEPTKVAGDVGRLSGGGMAVTGPTKDQNNKGQKRDQPSERSGATVEPKAAATTAAAASSSAASGPTASASEISASAASAKSQVAETAARTGEATASTKPAIATAKAATAPAANQRRSPAALVAVGVVVLGAAGLFLVRFFSSQATTTATSASAPNFPATTVTGAGEAEPAPQPSGQAAPAEPTIADAPSGSAGGRAAPAESVGATGDKAPIATADQAAAGGVAKTGAPSVEPIPHEPSVRKVTGAKRKTPAREERAAAAAEGETKSAEAGPAVATGPGATPVSAPAPAVPGSAAAPTTTKAEEAAAPSAASETGESVHQIRVTSKPDGADVTLDGKPIGKTPLSTSIANVGAPHFLAVRKEGFEPFEQMLSSSSPWAKTKATKGKPAQVLKIAAKLKPVAGTPPAATGTGATGAGATEAKPTAAEPAAAGGSDSPAGTKAAPIAAPPPAAAPTPAAPAPNPNRSPAETTP